MLIIGIILLSIYFITKQQMSVGDKVIYKYIPRTLKEEEESPIYVSEIFKTMFTQPSIWIDSINDDYNRRNEAINKYFVSQM